MLVNTCNTDSSHGTCLLSSRGAILPKNVKEQAKTKYGMIKGTVTRHALSAYRATACENPNQMNLAKISPSLNTNHVGRSHRECLLSLLEAATLSLTIGKAPALANIKLYTLATPRKAQPPQTATPTTHMKQHVPPFPTTPILQTEAGDLATAAPKQCAFTTTEVRPWALRRNR